MSHIECDICSDIINETFNPAVIIKIGWQTHCNDYPFWASLGFLFVSMSPLYWAGLGYSCTRGRELCTYVQTLHDVNFPLVRRFTAGSGIFSGVSIQRCHFSWFCRNSSLEFLYFAGILVFNYATFLQNVNQNNDINESWNLIFSSFKLWYWHSLSRPFLSGRLFEK